MRLAGRGAQQLPIKAVVKSDQSSPGAGERSLFGSRKRSAKWDASAEPHDVVSVSALSRNTLDVLLCQTPCREIPIKVPLGHAHFFQTQQHSAHTDRSNAMDDIFSSFKRAYSSFDGYGVAASISPMPPAHDAGRLYSFYRGSNHTSIQGDVRYALIYNNNLQMSKAESTAWAEVFVAYWKAVGEILMAEEASNQGRTREVDWAKVYEAWKEVVIALVKGHQAGALPSWTVPCLYIAGKYLRVFAIKADDQIKSRGNVTFNTGFQDDVVSSAEKNDKLEDAARQLMRMFSTCLNDRYVFILAVPSLCVLTICHRAPLEDSRKWGVYYVTNLLFKTHFKVRLSLYLAKPAWNDIC